MTLIYKFKKEKLENGCYAERPRILVELNGTIIIPALIDTGCDTTVIPEEIARAIGLKIKGEKHNLYAFRESNEVIESRVGMTFLGREIRQSEILPDIPVLIALAEDGIADEEDITIGIQGVFDIFDIAFKKSQNRIIFKRTANPSLLKKKA